MSDLSIFLFGSPYFELNGRSVTVDTRKAVALLAYLTVSGERHTRDSLATLFWPDYDQVHARSALRRTLSVLQKALEGGFLAISRDSLGLDSAGQIQVDVVQFRQHINAANLHHHPTGQACPDCVLHLEQAFKLYRGDFLAGFTLRDSSNFDEWQFFESEVLKREFATVLETLAAVSVGVGNFSSALEYAQRWLSMDALREDVHRTLMLIYAWTGQRNAALRQYRECLRILDQELGVSPLEETTQLYQAILENQIPPAPVASHTQPPDLILPPTPETRPEDLAQPLGKPYPLVGRSRESEIIEQAYQKHAATGHVLVLEGEPGIGKTRLADAFLAAVQARGATVINARSYPGEGNLAYGLLISGISALLSQPVLVQRMKSIPEQWMSEATRLLPGLNRVFPDLPAPPPLAGPGGQTRFFEGLRQFILMLLHNPLPGVLFLDDLQWADSASLDFLNYLVRRLDGNPVFILATWTDHLLPDSLQQLIAETQRRGSVTRVHLHRLNELDLTSLARFATRDLPDTPPDLGERLYRETEGLPFFAIEYLEAIVTAVDAMPRSDTGYLLPSTREWDLPPAVRDALLARLSAAGETGWQLLSTAAVIGRSFDFDTLLAASGRNESEAVAALEKLISSGIIDEQPAPQAGSVSYDFTHDQLRRLAYAETSQTRRRLIHRRVAEALALQSRHKPDPRILANQVAQHYHMAGQESQAAEYYLLAGEQALEVLAYQEAITNFQAALTAGHPETARLHEAIGDLMTLQGNYREALSEYETAASMIDPTPRLEQKIGNLHHRRGEWELAACHYQLALDALALQDNPDLRARILADWSLTAHNQGLEEQALQYARQSLELAKNAGLQPALASAHNILGILARRSGQPQEAIRHLQDSLALARQLNDPDSQVAALNNLALVYQDIGDLPQAIHHAQEALGICQTRGDRHREAALLNHLADLHYLSGDTTSAMAYLKNAVIIFSEIGVTEDNLLPEIWKLTEW